MEFGVGLVAFKMTDKEINTISKSISFYEPYYKVVVDNSPTDSSKHAFVEWGWKYIHDPSNPGFGASHNRIFHTYGKLASFHLIVNPDVSFDNNILEILIKFLKDTDDAGCVMPKVYYPSGKIQKSAKLLPTSYQLIFGRLWIFGNKIRRQTEFTLEQYNKGVFRAPFISGCFVLFKTEALNEVDFFDESFFMYMEDMDLSRRLWNAKKFPYFNSTVNIVHSESRGSTRNLRLLIKHLQSAFIYYFKWGFNNKEIREINRQAKKFILNSGQ
jgi:GT2 family glycosyltransferase